MMMPVMVMGRRFPTSSTTKTIYSNSRSSASAAATGIIIDYYDSCIYYHQIIQEIGEQHWEEASRRAACARAPRAHARGSGLMASPRCVLCHTRASEGIRTHCQPRRASLRPASASEGSRLVANPPGPDGGHVCGPTGQQKT